MMLFLQKKRQGVLAALLAIALMAPAMAMAQIDVTGTVVDATGEAIIGASVQVKGTSKGTVTDIDGNYSLAAVAPDAVITFSYVGYSPLEEKVNGRKTINVTMKEDFAVLNEVVVVGYGSLSKKELSSSIVQVDKSNFQAGAMNNPMEMITGKVAGLNVSTQSAADPNGSSSLQVRGATSISAANGPLVVIDGVAGGDIRNIAAQDIESMTVLKDAASAAIYGTRGANGVILITTRKGNEGGEGASVTYDSYAAINIAKGKPEILSPEEFRRSRRSNDYGYNTNWYEEITRNVAYDINQYIALDGSTKNGSYNASLSYKNANGLDIISKREEYGARFSLQQRAIENRLRFGASLSARKVKENWGNNGMFDTALTLNPTMPIYNEDGSFYQPTSATGIRNPVSELLLNTSQGNRNYILGTAELRWNILNAEKHKLYTDLSYSLHYNDLKSDYYTPSNSGESFWNGYKGRASITSQKWWTNRLEWTFNYDLNLGSHNVKVLAGYSYERSNWEQQFCQNNDFTFDNMLWHNIGSGSYLKEGLANMYAGKTESTLVGFFGRVNYNWNNIVMASASLRREGSTKFGKDKKWGNFPAASVAVELANLSFLEPYKDEVQSLKPRVSYGVTGRSDFDSYKSISTYSGAGSYFIDGAWVSGYAPSSNANPELGWEKLKSINIGVDFAIYNRLRGSIEYFDRRSEDLLYNYTAPQPPYVYSSILVNVGTTKNTGIELTLDFDAVRNKNFRWTTGVNYSYGTTKLTKLSSDIYKASYLDLYQKPGVGTTEYFFRVQEGGQIGQFYGYKYAGVDENKNMLVYNQYGDRVLTSEAKPEDKVIIGNGAPKHFLTWNNSFTYRDFDLSFMFSGAFGYKIFNMRKYGMGLQGCGTDNVLRSAYLDDSYIWSGGGVISSFFLENGNYFKLQNVTLGYNVPIKNRKHVQGLRIYLAAKNLFTLTKYSGNDPSTVSSTGITPGVDTNSAYPNATSLALGITFRFK